MIFQSVVAYGEIGGEKKDQLLKTELIGQGLVHKEVSRENYGGIGSDKLRINMLIGDLNNKDFEISSSKAKDSVVARETLSNQISREVLKGKNVVAGINGDMFSMENGVPIGSHIYDGNILINFKDAAWTKEKPAIVVYEDNKVEIGPVIIKGEFSHKSLEKEIGVVNKEFGRESDFAIFNSNLNSDKTFRLSDSSIRDGAFVVLKGNNIGDKITSGTSYKGVVVGKYDRYEEIAIAEDEVILYQLKDSGAYVKNNIIMGDEISYTFHTSVNEKDRNDIKTLMTSYNWLIKDGKVLSNSELVSMGYESGIIQSKNSRTAIGLTADNKIIALTTDKLSGKFTDSVGITSEECGKLMEEMGAVQAIGLDGGGSAQINIKEEGDMNIKVSNHPSDENERPITNGLLFLSNGQRTTEVGRVIVDKTTTIFTGGQKEFTVKAVDKNNNPINISNRKIEFSAELGTIDNEGKYIAPQKEGKDVVTVKVDGVSSIVEVTVVGVVDDFSFKDGKMMNLKVGEKKDIDLVGYKDGKVIEIPKSSIKFEVPPELGEVNGNVITVKDNIENGFRSNIKATVSGKTKEIMVVVGLTNLTLDNFEEGNIGRYKTNKNFVNSYDLSISTEESKSGNNSLKLSYDYSGWVTGNGAMYAYFNNWESLKAEIMPEKIGMWVYGDGKAPWLRGYLKDGDNKLITINFTQGNINWIGWKYVEVPINKNWKLPLKLYGVYAVETNKTHQGDKNYGGAIYFDDIKFIYDDSEDLIGPKTSMVNINDNIYSSEFEFSANITDDKSGVNDKSIVLKLDDKDIEYSFDKTTGMINAKLRGLKTGTHKIYLWAEDLNKNPANPYIEKTFKVDLESDKEAPKVTNITPFEGAIEKAENTRIAFNVVDRKTGVDKNSIKLSIDDKPIDVFYDKETGWAYGYPETGLEDGNHNFKITAKDNSGNSTGDITSGFILKKINQPKDKNNFKIDILTDTHLTGFENSFIKKINSEDADLVIHNGDSIDQGKQEEIIKSKAELDKLKSDYIITPGNHEAFQGDLDNFYKNFGSGTYHLNFGNLTIISLNSAFGQSISYSDSSQFNYLERVLSENKNSNILVVTHVPTKDDFSTGHEINPIDKDKLEAILGKYKKDNNDKSIMVSFGHLHTTESWDKDGVNYFINGDGALKKYVSNDDGNLLGYGEIKVNDGSANWSFKPYLSKIYVNDPTINPKDNTLYIAKGSSRSLNVYGDFSEGNSNYIVNLSKFVYVEKVYSSEDNTVAYVDKSGKVTAKAIGETTIKVEIEGKQSNLKIRVVDPTTINVKDIKLSLEKDKTVVGYKNTIIPMVSDYDENSFYIESKFLDVKALDDKISIGKDNEILALKSGKAKIEVSYKDITKYLDIDVNEKPKNIVVNSGELIDKDRLRDAIDFENSIEIIGSLWTLEINDKKTIEELYKLTKDKLQMTLEEDKSKLEKNQISSLNVITNIGELPEGSYNLKVSVPKELDNSMLKIETLDDKKLLGEGLVTNSRISFEVKSLKGKLVLSTKEQKKPEGNGENNNGSSNNTGNSNSNNNVIQNEKKEENTNTLPRTGAVLNSVNIFIFAILLILIGAVLRRYRKV